MVILEEACSMNRAKRILMELTQMIILDSFDRADTLYGLATQGNLGYIIVAVE